MDCPCTSNKAFEDCCEPFLLGKAKAETPEQVMRSRYTAYVQKNINYLKHTLTKKSQKDFDPEASKEWADGVKWKGLEVISTTDGGPSDQKGVVEFIAKFKQKNEAVEHHEVAHFERDEKGDWKFDDGESHTHKDGEVCEHGPKIEPFVRLAPKVGRNDPCTCGSGKKFKKCCA